MAVNCSQKQSLRLEPAVRQILAQVVADPAVARRLAGWNGFQVTPIGGGRTARHVFVLTDTGGARDATALVVKVVDRDAGQCERSAYETWVGHLPQSSCPELLGYAERDELAALCLTRIGAPGAQTLTNHLQSGDSSAVRKVLTQLVPDLAAAWYSTPTPTANLVLAERYSTRFFPDRATIAEAEARLRDLACAHFPDFPIPSIAAILFSPKQRRTGRACVLHGDFNSDNVILDRTGMFVLDFQTNGPGHIYEDLVSLEASVRINWPGGGSAAAILAVEQGLARGGANFAADEYAALVHEVREAALTRFGSVDGRANHHYANAAIGLRLMLAKDLTVTAQLRIVAATISATMHLQRQSSGQASARGRNSSSRLGASTTRPHPALHAQRPLSAP